MRHRNPATKARFIRYDSNMSRPEQEDTPSPNTAEPQPGDRAASRPAEFVARVAVEKGQAWGVDVLRPERKLRLESAAANLAKPGSSAPVADNSFDHGDFLLVREEQHAARVVSRLARAQSSRAELLEIFTRYELTVAFSDAIAEEVSQLEQHPGFDDPTLEDLTHLPFVTIDGASSLDLDQAAYVTRDAEGFVVYYALADASYYVRPGTALWTEAMRRAASYYLPGVMVPMLPRKLSEGLVSLNPHVPRRALVLRTRLHDDGRLRQTNGQGATRAFRALIQSRAKLSFAEVQDFYERNDDAFEDQPIRESLLHLRSVGLARQKLAEERNVVRFRRVELDVQLDGKRARRFVAAEAIRHPVEAYNEQLSLLCNSEGARLLRLAADNPLIEPIYRVHPPPETARLDALRKLTIALADRHRLSERWIWHVGQPLSDYLENLPKGAQTDRVALAIHRQAVMVNVASSYQSLPEGHFGVGAEVYARFSSPMREIVGVFLHRELLQALEGSAMDDRELRSLVIERANAAKQIQKRVTNEANLLVLDQLFGDQLLLAERERRLDATIVGLTRSKAYVLFEQYPIDAKVHLRDLRHQYDDITVSEDGAALEVDGGARWAIGDQVRVVVFAHDQKRRHWHLGLV